MIIIACALIGALWGYRQARTGGGNSMDRAQYAAGYGIAFAIVGVIITIVVARSGLV